MPDNEKYLEVSTGTAESLGIGPSSKFVVVQKNESLLSTDEDEVPVFLLIPHNGPDAEKLAVFICNYLNETLEMDGNSWRAKCEDCIHIPFRRAGGDVLCSCGKMYKDHPMDSIILSGLDHNPFLHVLCNGDRVKL